MTHETIPNQELDPGIYTAEAQLSPDLMLSVAAMNEISAKRAEGERSQDSVLSRPDLGVFAVADGVGGNVGGALASRIATETLSRWAEANAPRGRLNTDGQAALLESMAQAVYDIQENLRAEGAKSPGLRDMATTFTAGVVFEDETGLPHFAHLSIGDSSMHEMHDGQHQQITYDEGVGRTIYNFLGANPDYNVAINNKEHRIKHDDGTDEADNLKISPMKPGSRLLITSDGITGDTPEQRLTEDEYIAALSADSPAAAVQNLLEVSRKVDDKGLLVIDFVSTELTAANTYTEHLGLPNHLRRTDEFKVSPEAADPGDRAVPTRAAIGRLAIAPTAGVSVGPARNRAETPTSVIETRRQPAETAVTEAEIREFYKSPTGRAFEASRNLLAAAQSTASTYGDRADIRQRLPAFRNQDKLERFIADSQAADARLSHTLRQAGIDIDFGSLTPEEADRAFDSLGTRLQALDEAVKQLAHLPGVRLGAKVSVLRGKGSDQYPAGYSDSGWQIENVEAGGKFFVTKTENGQQLFKRVAWDEVIRLNS